MFAKITMKWVIRFIIGIIVSIILLTICESWIFSNSEFDWLENLNENALPGEFHSEDFDWNGDVR